MKFFQITLVVTKKNCPEITLSLLRLNGEQVNFLPAFYSLTSINDIYKYKKKMATDYLICPYCGAKG